MWQCTRILQAATIEPNAQAAGAPNSQVHSCGVDLAGVVSCSQHDHLCMKQEQII